MLKQPQTKPTNLYEYLDAIRTRVPMYIGTKSLKALAIHISGFEEAEWIYGIRESEYPDFMEFHDFVANQYGLTSSTEGWPTIILRNEKGDEEKALDEFYKLFDLFKQRKGFIQ